MRFFFFFNDTATTEIYTLSLHDALPICRGACLRPRPDRLQRGRARRRALRHRRRLHRRFSDRSEGGLALRARAPAREPGRSEEHTSELQSQSNLVCRLLLEKKKNDRAPP